MSAAAAAPPPPSGTRAMFGVFGAGVVTFIALGIVLPVLPRFVRGPLDEGDVAVGLVIGGFAITGVIVRPFAGRFADARGRRVVFLTGTLLIALAGALYFVPAGVPGLVFARLVLGLGDGMVFTAGAAWIVDLAPSDRRGQAIGMFGLAIWTALSFGPVLGELLLSAAGYGAVWAVAVAAPLAGALVAVRVPDRHRPDGEPSRTLLPRAALRPGLALMLANVGYAAIASFVVLHLAAARVGGGAAVFTVFAVAVVSMRVLGGRLPDRAGARPCAIAAALMEAAGLGLIAAAGVLPVAIAGAVLMGAGFSLLYPALALLVVERVPESQRGAALGAFSAFFDIGVGIGAPVIGVVAALAGYPAAFAAAAAVSFAGALVTAGAALGRGRASAPAAAG